MFMKMNGTRDASGNSNDVVSRPCSTQPFCIQNIDILLVQFIGNKEAAFIDQWRVNNRVFMVLLSV